MRGVLLSIDALAKGYLQIARVLYHLFEGQTRLEAVSWHWGRIDREEVDQVEDVAKLLATP